MSQYNTDTVWVGMDVHQDSITAAILFGDDPKAEPGGKKAQRAKVKTRRIGVRLTKFRDGRIRFMRGTSGR